MRSLKNQPTYSFEFFPPKDVEGEERLWTAMSQLESIAPDFISVTYGAGGSTRDRTIRITSEITARTHIPTVAHLTCVGSTRDELLEILGKYRDAGIKSILALRGDPTGGPRAPWVATPGGLNHADELVTLAAEFGGFTIGVAAFPDGHPASGNDFSRDIDVLIEKERRGAAFATTQFFFEVEQHETRACSHQRIGRHQLRMRKPLIDVFVDDVGLIQHQLTLDQDRYLTIGVHGRDVFRLIEQINVTDLEIHAFLKKHQAATLRKRAGRARVENHHDYRSLKQKGETTTASPCVGIFRAILHSLRR